MISGSRNAETSTEVPRMSDALITILPPDLKEIARGVALMQLPPNLRRRWLARMGRMVIAQAQKNIKDQKTVSGSPMEPRKRKPPEKRRVYHKDGTFSWKKTHPEMLHDLVKSKWLGVKADSDKAMVSFFRNVGYVGFKHQYGTSEVFRRGKAEEVFSTSERNPGSRKYWEKCSEKHAAALVANGFPKSEKWIQENFSAGHAFHVLRSMKKEWTINGTARPFLGIDGRTKQSWGDELQRGIYERFKAKNHSNLLK